MLLVSNMRDRRVISREDKRWHVGRQHQHDMPCSLHVESTEINCVTGGGIVHKRGNQDYIR
jgi:hypothetical protein